MWNRLKDIQWINKNLINFLIFLLLLGWIFVRTTYLFRNCTYDREHVNGIRNEENIDVVCIGGSSTFVYWEPYLAWKEYGMTSYNLATNSATPPVIENYTKYMAKIQNPELIVIDTRSYIGEVGSISEDEGAIRNMTDSLPMSGNRFQAVTDTLIYYDAFKDENTDITSFYFDISKYHGIYERLGSEINWNYRNNDFKSEYKGFEFVEDPCHSIIQEISNQTKERMELDLRKEESLRDLLEFLCKNKIEALFVAGPAVISKEERMQFNTIGDIISSYDYDFLNTNDYYKEMDIDFSEDFYNAGHVNVYGAEKYTMFVSHYIKEHYNITDHRGDESYAEWNADYLAAKERETYIKGLIDQQVEVKKKANQKGLGLRGMEDNFDEWCDVVVDENYTVLILSKGEVPNVSMPWNISDKSKDVIRIYAGNVEIYESDIMLDRDYEGTIGTDYIKFCINSGDKSKLLIDGKQYRTEDEGLYILVFDNNYNQVLDVVMISGKENVWKHI